jgi:hypothetical protein
LQRNYIEIILNELVSIQKNLLMRLIGFFLVLFSLNTIQLSAINVDSLLLVLEEVKKKGVLTEIYQVNYELAQFYKSREEEKYEQSTFHYNEA